MTSLIPSFGPCYPNLFSEGAYLGLCVPLVNVGNNATSAGYSLPNLQALQASFNSNSATTGRLYRYLGELARAWPVLVVAGGVGGLVLSFLFLLVIRLCAGFLVWLVILLVNAAFIAITLYCFAKAGLLGYTVTSGGIDLTGTAGIYPSSCDKVIWEACGGVMAGLSGLLLLFTLLMLRRIRIAIATVKVAAQALGAMPQVLFFPLLPILLEVGLFVYWVAVLAYIWTTGTVGAKARALASVPFLVAGIEAPLLSLPPPLSTFTFFLLLPVPNSPTGSGYTIVYSNNFYYVFIYHLFGLLWTTQFIAGFGTMVLAGAFAHFYWSKGDLSNLPGDPVLASLKRTFFYHLGSIALGSFVVAVVQFVQIVLEVSPSRALLLCPCLPAAAGAPVSLSPPASIPDPSPLFPA